MKPTGAKAWSRALVAAVSLCAAGAWADCYKYDTKNGTVDLGASTQINSTDRFIIYQGTVNLNTGASVKAGGNNSGSCNFIGIDKDNVSGVLNINGGTFWCATAKGSGYLGVGNKGTSWVDLNPGKSSAILPPGDAPFTIEMWTTLRAITEYSAWFTLGRKDNTGTRGLMVAFHNTNAHVRPYNSSTGTGPAFQAVNANGSEQKNVLMGKNPLTAGGAREGEQEADLHGT